MYSYVLLVKEVLIIVEPEGWSVGKEVLINVEPEGWCVGIEVLIM